MHALWEYFQKYHQIIFSIITTYYGVESCTSPFIKQNNITRNSDIAIKITLFFQNSLLEMCWSVQNGVKLVNLDDFKVLNKNLLWFREKLETWVGDSLSSFAVRLVKLLPKKWNYLKTVAQSEINKFSTKVHD